MSRRGRPKPPHELSRAEWNKTFWPEGAIVQTDLGPAVEVGPAARAEHEPAKPRGHADPQKRRHRGPLVTVNALVAAEDLEAATVEPTPCKTIGCSGRTTRSRGPLSNLCDTCAEKKRDLISKHQSAMRARDANDYRGQVVRASERVVSLRWQLREAEAELDRLVTEHHRGEEASG